MCYCFSLELLSAASRPAAAGAAAAQRTRHLGGVQDSHRVAQRQHGGREWSPVVESIIIIIIIIIIITGRIL